MQRALSTYSRFVKFEHSVFSLPMLFAGATAELRSWPSARNMAWMIVAGVGARTLAMALNRIIDREIDGVNPRTAARDLPSGRLSIPGAAGIAFAGFGAYLAGAAVLGGWCLRMAWLPLIFFVAYPFLKRVTSWCHLVLGMTLGLSPLAGAVAADPARLPGVLPYLLTVFTTFWVTGFDIIYATLDEAFDRAHGLKSAIVALGRPAALRWAAVAHGAAWAVLAGVLVLLDVHPWHWLAAGVVAVLFFIEHRKRDHVDFAFFQVNAVLGVFVLAATSP